MKRNEAQALYKLYFWNLTTKMGLSQSAEKQTIAVQTEPSVHDVHLKFWEQLFLPTVEEAGFDFVAIGCELTMLLLKTEGIQFNFEQFLSIQCLPTEQNYKLIIKLTKTVPI